MTLNKEDVEVCQRIRHLFELSGMTQLEFSNSIGMTQGSLSNIIRERQQPGSRFIMAILREYSNVNSRWIFLGEEPIFSTPDQQLSKITRRTKKIGGENDNQDAVIKPPKDINCYEELRKCRERCDSIQDLLNQKNDEVSQLQREFIAHLKNKT